MPLNTQHLTHEQNEIKRALTAIMHQLEELRIRAERATMPETVEVITKTMKILADREERPLLPAVIIPCTAPHAPPKRASELSAHVDQSIHNQ